MKVGITYTDNGYIDIYEVSVYHMEGHYRTPINGATMRALYDLRVL